MRTVINFLCFVQLFSSRLNPIFVAPVDPILPHETLPLKGWDIGMYFLVRVKQNASLRVRTWNELGSHELLQTEALTNPAKMMA